ncbi:MAG TPA: sugar ABC transporter permease [Limnochordia bacterium]|jgi:multiple sugar transport system permease protein|nr:sugar ABC transporter permease [Bacillota bacterium]HAI52317.1 ABC transporter permease [Bacillota bacterium]HOK32839.1 sugar ABC transporter permease [Limnochordia bacterium]
MRRGKRLTLRQQQEVWAYAFLGIPLLFFAFIRFYPALSAFNISLRDWSLLTTAKPFVGLQNYRDIFADEVFWKALKNTFTYALLGVPLQLIIGLSVALLLHNIKRWVPFFRALYFVPYVTSVVAVAWVWRFMYQPHIGIINRFLLDLGFEQIQFLRNPSTALYSILAMIIWHGVGFQIVLFLAGLQMIPDMYYEAAQIDGANSWQIFFRITLPLLNPTIVFVVVMSSIRYLQVFSEVMNMSNEGLGGPLNSTISTVLHIYRTAFHRFDMGRASAMTVVLFAIVLVITIIQMKLVTRKYEF